MLVSSISWPEQPKLKIYLKSHIISNLQGQTMLNPFFSRICHLWKWNLAKSKSAWIRDQRKGFSFGFFCSTRTLFSLAKLWGCANHRCLVVDVTWAFFFAFDMFLKWEIIDYEWKYPHQVTSLEPLWLMMVKLLHFFCDLKQKPSVKYCEHVNIVQPVYSWRS